MNTNDMIYGVLSSTPDTPPTNKRMLYPKADGWYDLSSAGVETKIGESALAPKTIELNLSAADIIGLYPDGIEVIPAEVDKVHSILKIVCIFTPGDTQFTNGGNFSLFSETNFNQLTGNIITAAVVNGASSKIVISEPSASVEMLANEGIYIQNIGSNFATGNGTLKVLVTYQTLDV